MIVDPKGWRLQCIPPTNRPTTMRTHVRDCEQQQWKHSKHVRRQIPMYCTIPCIPKSTSHGPEHKTPVVKRDRGHPMSRHMDGKDRLDGRLMSVISGPFRNRPVRRPPRLFVVLQVMGHGSSVTLLWLLANMEAPGGSDYLIYTTYSRPRIFIMLAIPKFHPSIHPSNTVQSGSMVP
ncbi:hypothetical protein GE21DRAFT_1124147 [Neurospora crassa]|nr:hypothetical protein GE21DRAFT_1124147 [Neurospora crassa]